MLFRCTFEARNPIPTVPHVARVFSFWERHFSHEDASTERGMNPNAMSTSALSECTANDTVGHCPAARISVLIERLKSEQKSGPAPSAKNVEVALQLANGKADAIFSVPPGSRGRLYKLRDRIIALGLHNCKDNSLHDNAVGLEVERLPLSVSSNIQASSLASGELPCDLLVKPTWVRAHAPGVHRLEVTCLQHRNGTAERKLRAQVDDLSTEGEVTERVASYMYDLPVASETLAEAAARGDRNRRREEKAIRELDGIAAVEHQAKKAKQQAVRRDEERAIQAELSTILDDLVSKVAATKAWTEDRSSRLHWLRRSMLQLLSWPPVYASLCGDLGQPLPVGSWAWLPDPQNEAPPRLACVNKWFCNGHAEFMMLNEETMAADPEQRRCVLPSQGVVLSLDERRPRYVGEHVRLWGKIECLGLRGTEDEIFARAASASTCPDYRPTLRVGDGTNGGGTGTGECYAPVRPDAEMYRFDELGFDASESIHAQREKCPLRQAEALLNGLSQVAMVTAVHPCDVFAIQNNKVALPRQFITSSCGYGKGGKEFRLGKQKYDHSTGWAIGSVDVALFDARTASFTGPKLHNVPLFLVNGCGRSSAVMEAKLVAYAELFRFTEDDNLGADEYNAAMDAIAAAEDVNEVHSALDDWLSDVDVRKEVWGYLTDLQSIALHETRLQSFVSARFVEQFRGSDPTWLSGQDRFPDQLPELRAERPIQEYEVEETGWYWSATDWSGIRSGVLRTDYLLW